MLILHHGRGADGHDLLGLADVLDPKRRRHLVTPRGPLTLPGWPGYHWYTVPRVGYPDRPTFDNAYWRLAAFHDELWQHTGIAPEQTVLGGFSMGSVMSYALGLGGDRPVPAGIFAFSGFIPTVERRQPDLGSRAHLPVFITHRRRDPIMDVSFARRARDLLETGGLPVSYPRVRRRPPDRPQAHPGRHQLAGRHHRYRPAIASAQVAAARIWRPHQPADPGCGLARDPACSTLSPRRGALQSND